MKEDELVEYHYKAMITSLKLLTIPYDEQKERFQNFNNVRLCFELTNTYQIAFVLLPQVIEQRYFDYNVIANLIHLNNRIDSFFGNPNYEGLDDKSLFNTKSWLEIVEIAKETLLMHGETE
jgi:hypothetical protein